MGLGSLQIGSQQVAVLSYRCERPAVAVWLGVAVVQLPVDMHMLMACGLRAKLLDQPHLA